MRAGTTSANNTGVRRPCPPRKPNSANAATTGHVRLGGGGGATTTNAASSSSYTATGQPSSQRATVGLGRGHVSPPPTSNTGTGFITNTQRDALKLSAFGFGTSKSNVGPASGASASGVASKTTAREQAAARSWHTSGRTDVVVTRPEKDSTKFHLCVQALSEGCVQSYMHLFMLAHREPVCVDALSKTFFTLSDEEMVWVQQQLCLVETLRRRSEFDSVNDHCMKLADFFEKARDVEESAWHYEAALRYAMESLDRTLEQTVRHRFGNFYERQGMFEEAADMYERMYRMAVALQREDDAREANVELVRVYQVLGEHYRLSDPARAKKFFERSVKAAQRSQCGADEAQAYHALGELSEQTGNLNAALAYQRSFHMTSRREQNRSAECDALLDVAGLEERLGLNTNANTSLKEALELASQLGDPSKVCRATMKLGEVSRAQANEEGAMECFERAFEAAVASGDADLIDSARIAMGFARGEYHFMHAGDGRGYLPIVCDDIKSQLAWMSNGVL